MSDAEIKLRWIRLIDSQSGAVLRDLYTLFHAKIENTSLDDTIVVQAVEEQEAVKYSGKALLKFAGVLDESAATEMENAVDDCRKIDVDEW